MADADIDRFALGFEPDRAAQTSAFSRHGISANDENTRQHILVRCSAFIQGRNFGVSIKSVKAVLHRFAAEPVGYEDQKTRSVIAFRAQVGRRMHHMLDAMNDERTV
jgi:hypothetical protein